jgi:hypothetical protein
LKNLYNGPALMVIDVILIDMYRNGSYTAAATAWSSGIGTDGGVGLSSCAPAIHGCGVVFVLDHFEYFMSFATFTTLAST